MTRLALQEAAAAIVVAYLSHHEVESDRLPLLLTAVAQALSPASETPAAPPPVIQIAQRRRKTKAPAAGELQQRRIERVDQLEMPWQGEGDDGQPIEGKEELGDQAAQLITEQTDTAASAQEGEFRPRRDGDTRGVAEGYGVRITRLPEVRRGRRRLA